MGVDQENPRMKKYTSNKQYKKLREATLDILGFLKEYIKKMVSSKYKIQIG